MSRDGKVSQADNINAPMANHGTTSKSRQRQSQAIIGR
jgi:hypothetical protein